MGLKKEVLIFAAFSFLLFFLGNVYALGISPAFKEFNFKSGLKETVTFDVIAPPDFEVETFVEGDLAQYVELDKNSVMGGEKFTAKISLPESIENPGLNRIGIGIAQKIDPELASGFIGTRIVIISQIDIYVPYPGRYLEIDLQGHDVNIGEPVNFLLDIESEGKEDVNITPRIDIFSKEGMIESLEFKDRVIASQEKITLKKMLDTSKYNPGVYKAIAVVDYGIPAIDEFNFRIGSLNIDIINYTSVFPVGGLHKFEVLFESSWNDKIDGAYAEIKIMNNSKVLETIKTSSTDLTPWQRESVAGYFDTSNFTKTFYDANITAVYYGKEQGKSSSKIVKIQFIGEKSLLVWYIIGGAGAVLFVLTLFFSKFKKIKHAKKRK